ncbi:MAG: hypothetical protein JWL63_187 [Rhodocyclales bacterium]|nr:hypothetical protein [Rhodocyclales bacterium]
MIPFVVIFVLAGIGLVYAGRKMERDAIRAGSWPATDGHLERCEVVEVLGTQVDDTSSWQLKIEYSYVVRGVTYRSDRYAFGYGDGRDDTKHRMIVDALKRSPDLSVRYDPAHPSEAVISTEVQTNLTTLGYSTLVLAVISALIAWAIR